MLVSTLTALALAAGAAAAQVPRTATIELYGLRKITRARIQEVLGVRAGDPLPPSKGGLEERLEQIPGVAQARLEAVCCDRGLAVLFVGIRETGAAPFVLRPAPAGDARLPGAVVATWRRFLVSVTKAARRGSATEDLTHGHSLLADPDARLFQAGFVDYAGGHMTLLRNVLHNAADAEHRLIAASLIAYAPWKGQALVELQYALQDPAEDVRASAARSIEAIAVLARRSADLALEISPAGLIGMLNSIVLGDRLRAAEALVDLTEPAAGASRTAILEQIRSRALDALLEMARWQTLRYALPAYVLAGRIGGLSEKQIADTWTRGERETVLARLDRR